MMILGLQRGMCKGLRTADCAEGLNWTGLCAGEQGSEYTYNTMIKVASYAGDFERALAVLDDMETAGVAPTAAIWGSLLVACGKVCLSL